MVLFTLFPLSFRTVALKLASKRGGCISPMKNVFDISAVKAGKYTLMCNEMAAKEKLVVEKPMYKNVTVKQVPRLRQAVVTIEVRDNFCI